jgi:hypothetical protein
LFRNLAPLLQAGSIELLLATARSDAAISTAATRIIPCARDSTVPRMRLAGVRAAAAPLIAITEDFCVPAQGWAEALLEARRHVDAAVLGGPVARRNGTASDWALTLVEYGRFFRCEPEGEVEDLPSINIAYDCNRLRDALQGAEGLFEMELHPALRARGERFWRVPNAVMLDENTDALPTAIRAQYRHGRFFGGRRVEGRSKLQRLVRFAAAPAVPAVLLSRIAREVAASGHAADLLRALPALAVLIGGWAAGEAVGSLLGEGGSGAHWK